MLNAVLKKLEEKAVFALLGKEETQTLVQEIIKISYAYDCNPGEILEDMAERVGICSYCLKRADEFRDGVCPRCYEGWIVQLPSLSLKSFHHPVSNARVCFGGGAAVAKVGLGSRLVTRLLIPKTRRLAKAFSQANSVARVHYPSGLSGARLTTPIFLRPSAKTYFYLVTSFPPQNRLFASIFAAFASKIRFLVRYPAIPCSKSSF
jgi:hypothetical protein